MDMKNKAVVDARQTFNTDGLSIQALSRVHGWTYLGISFTPDDGRSTVESKTRIVVDPRTASSQNDSYSS